MNLRILCCLLAASLAALAGDGEFDRIVKAIETHYGTKRTHIPLMGVANLFVKVARPAGTSGFHLAVFEDLPALDDNDEEMGMDRFMDGLPTGRLHRMIRTRSRRNGESTYIYAGGAGKSTRILIATFERHEATVIEATVNAETLARMLEDPGHARRMFGDKDDR